MVNPDSPTFKFSEKIGLVVGTMIRYALIGSGIILLSSLLKIKNKRPSNTTPNGPNSFK